MGVDIAHRGVCIIAKPARHDRKINTAELCNHFHRQIVHMTVSRKLPSQLMSVEVFSFLLHKIVRAILVCIEFTEGLACTKHSFTNFF
jgi:hypothetical protein